MSRTRVSACAFVVAASLAGCTGTGDVEYAGEVVVTSPDLVEIQPGVMVVADADEPIFYAHGDYWLYRDGYWLRSNDYRRGYMRVEFTYVPTELRVIERPQLYVNYRRNLGRNRAARTPDMRTRSQPTYQQPAEPQAQPTYPPPRAQPVRPTYPTTSPSSPVYQPNQPPRRGQPGANPIEPTPPPGPTSPATPPNDSRREPQPQRNAPPDVDRSTPPGHEHERPSDRSDRATPPASNKTDDRTKSDDTKKSDDTRNDEKKDKKDKKRDY